MAQEPLIKDAGQIIEKFVETVKNRDAMAAFKLMAQDAMLVDFEGNAMRGAACQGFLKDWPPKSSNLKIEKTQINGNSATIRLVIRGGAYAKDTNIRIELLLNDQFKIKSLRYTMPTM